MSKPTKYLSVDVESSSSLSKSIEKIIDLLTKISNNNGSGGNYVQPTPREIIRQTIKMKWYYDEQGEDMHVCSGTFKIYPENEIDDIEETTYDFEDVPLGFSMVYDDTAIDNGEFITNHLHNFTAGYTISHPKWPSGRHLPVAGATFVIHQVTSFAPNYYYTVLQPYIVYPICEYFYSHNTAPPKIIGCICFSKISRL